MDVREMASRGGKARAQALSAKRRHQIAVKGGKAYARKMKRLRKRKGNQGQKGK